MKKLYLSILLILCLSLSLCSCTDNAQSNIPIIPMLESSTQDITQEAYLQIQMEQAAEEAAAEETATVYIGNKKTKKFHLDSCHTLPNANNRVELSGREEAVNQGYKPCKNCNP